jgi:hypothetical protein
MTREALFMSLIPRAVWPANRALFRKRESASSPMQWQQLVHLASLCGLCEAEQSW